MPSGWENLKSTYCGRNSEDSNMASTAQQSMIIDAFQSEVYVSNRMDVQHTPLYVIIRT